MVKMGTLYTLATYTVKPGNENAFIGAWRDFAVWTQENIPGSQTGVLLQDAENPLKFLSFGPWPNKDLILRWRNTSEFRQTFTIFRDLCTEIQPHTMGTVASSDR